MGKTPTGYAEKELIVRVAYVNTPLQRIVLRLNAQRLKCVWETLEIPGVWRRWKRVALATRMRTGYVRRT